MVAEDVAAFARNKELAQAVLAMDVLRSDMPTLPADMHLPEALGIFSRPHCAESLALVNPNNDLLLGVVNKTDLYLVLSESCAGKSCNKGCLSALTSVEIAEKNAASILGLREMSVQNRTPGPSKDIFLSPCPQRPPFLSRLIRAWHQRDDVFGDVSPSRS